MTIPHRSHLTSSTALALAIGAFGLAVVPAACTPATQDPPASGGGVGGQSNPGLGGSGGAAGDDTGVGGKTGAGSAGSLGTAGSAGAAGSVHMGGDGGGTSTDAGGAGGSPGGGTGGTTVAATGCNWSHDTATDLWKLNPAITDKIVLFDGTSLANWHKLGMPGVAVSWKLLPDGTMQVVPSGTGQATEIQSNMKFDDVCVHVEYLTPVFPSTTTDVQKQGNSGVYLKSAYELQILDTHNSPPLIDGCGAVYKVAPPLVVACNMYLVWNTYEIEFKSSVWDTSNPPKKTKDAVFVRVALNGKLVQLNVDLNPAGGFTQAGIPDVAGPQPLGLQDHLDLVSFRNIWVTIPRY